MKFINHVSQGTSLDTTFRDGQWYGLLHGRYFPVVGLVWSKAERRFLLVLDVPEGDEIVNGRKEVTA